MKNLDHSSCILNQPHQDNAVSVPFFSPVTNPGQLILNIGSIIQQLRNHETILFH